MGWRRVLGGGDGGGGRVVEGHENAMATSFSFPIWYGISGNELMKGDCPNPTAPSYMDYETLKGQEAEIGQGCFLVGPTCQVMKRFPNIILEAFFYFGSGPLPLTLI